MIVSPLDLGLWDPFQMAFPWFINGGDPSHLRVLGWSFKCPTLSWIEVWERKCLEGCRFMQTSNVNLRNSSRSMEKIWGKTRGKSHFVGFYPNWMSDILNISMSWVLEDILFCLLEDTKLVGHFNPFLWVFFLSIQLPRRKKDKCLR